MSEQNMSDKDAKKRLAEIQQAEFLRACRNSGFSPGMGKAIVQSEFNNLEEYRKWKSRLKG